MSKVNLKRRVQKMIPEKSRLDRAVNEATNLQLAFQDEIKKEGVEITWGGRSLTRSTLGGSYSAQAYSIKDSSGSIVDLAVIVEEEYETNKVTVCVQVIGKNERWSALTLGTIIGRIYRFRPLPTNAPATSLKGICEVTFTWLL
jgi:hypothetical protein